ncbi:MAG: hypothetical protein ACJASU_001772 [Cognaticolwellia sp.]|jgi:hypothetical protein
MSYSDKRDVRVIMKNVNDYAQEVGEIFVLSDSFVRVKSLIDDEQSTIAHSADVILLAPSISGNYFKTCH